jgi:hypothetical protein
MVWIYFLLFACFKIRGRAWNKGERMLGKKPPLTSRLIALGSLVFVGALLVGITVWLLLSLVEPAPTATPEATPGTNFTPYVGKKW